MSDLTGAAAFDQVLQELLQRAAAADDSKRLHSQVDILREQLRLVRQESERHLARATKAEAGAQHITNLWRETECVRGLLVAWSRGTRVRREVAAEHAADLKKRLDAAADYVDLIPF